MRKKGALLGLVLASGLLGAGVAAAQESAQALMHRAMAERRAGDYDKAAAHFRRAFELSGETNYLFLLAETQREAGLVKDALASYRRYLELAPGAPDAAVARDHIETLAQQPQVAPGQIAPALRDPPPVTPAPRRLHLDELPAAPPQLAVSKGGELPPEVVPLHRRPWLWVVVGAAAAGGLVLGLSLGLRPSAPSLFVAPGALP